MESSKPDITNQPIAPVTTGQANWPITKIRTETVLSRLPIHNLAKRGQVNIQIMKKNGEGEVTLQWEVSHSERYGQPRQIAYKLDTIVINRRIDETGRPLPKMICLGSLRDMAAELGLGGDTNQIRRALRQNAFAGITAKMTYRAADGTEKRLEADFTRYGVVFTGEKLPDGRRADSVYVILNEPYREVLNNAPVRPLNYDYLKALPPAAQRFYEVISYRVFAALTSRSDEARISYSDYCAFSAQNRYFDYDHFKKQMYKIHRLHLQSGYLRTVRYSAATDAEGRSDWMMCYAPGPRAEAEFRAFSARGKRGAGMPGNSELDSAAGEWTAGNRSERSVQAPGTVTTPSPNAKDLVRLFHRLARGVKEYEVPPGSNEGEQADELLRAHGPDVAQFAVTYAVAQAEKTNFAMRRFGALAQYIPEAVAEFERRKRNAEGTRNREVVDHEKRRRAEMIYRAGKKAISTLTDNARAALYSDVKAELALKYPRTAGKESQFCERMIEAAMISRLAVSGSHDQTESLA